MSEQISKKPHCSEEQQGFFGSRAEDGTRTRDPNLGKVMLYQLSYFRIAFLCFCECKGSGFFETTKAFGKEMQLFFSF